MQTISDQPISIEDYHDFSKKLSGVLTENKKNKELIIQLRDQIKALEVQNQNDSMAQMEKNDQEHIQNNENKNWLSTNAIGDSKAFINSDRNKGGRNKKHDEEFEGGEEEKYPNSKYKFRNPVKYSLISQIGKVD